MSMDEKFRSDEQWFISPIVNVRAFKETAEDEVIFTNTRMGISDEYEPDVETLSSFLGCSSRTTNKILKDISVEKLLESERRKVDDEFETVNQTTMLEPEIIKTHRECVERFKKFSDSAVKGYITGRMKYYKWEQYGIKLNQVVRDTPRHLTDDIIMTVNIGRAHNRIFVEDEKRPSSRMYPITKFIVRGSTLLSSLREKIMCDSDFGAYIEEGKELEKPEPSNFYISQYPSSFFFIHDTFYTDNSRAECVDISVEIRQFMASKPIFGPTKVEKMEGVTMMDLTLRLGQPYLFLHSGNCEHLITFTDLRLMTKDDEQEATRYPLMTFSRGEGPKCTACKKMEATMGVEECSRLPLTPAFFCERCFREFHFSHGQRVGEFRAFPHFRANRI